MSETNNHKAATKRPCAKRQRSSTSTTGVGINAKQLSHSLSWALRHAAEQLNLPMANDGYVPVQEILALSQHHRKFKGVTWELLKMVVETNDKQRFSLAERPRGDFYKCGTTATKSINPTTVATTTITTTTTKTTTSTSTCHGTTNPLNSMKSKDTAQKEMTDSISSSSTNETTTILCIRANQGHSIKTINPNLIYTPISPETLLSFPMIVHGTYKQHYKSILEQGLKCMNRTHIHFAPGLGGSKSKQQRRQGQRNDPGDSEMRSKCTASKKENVMDSNLLTTVTAPSSSLPPSIVISGMRQSADVFIYVDAQKCIDDDIPFFQSSNGVILTDGGINNNHESLPTRYFSHITDAQGNVLLDQRGDGCNNDTNES